jgi:hypothetical protein
VQRQVSKAGTFCRKKRTRLGSGNTHWRAAGRGIGWKFGIADAEPSARTEYHESSSAIRGQHAD